MSLSITPIGKIVTIHSGTGDVTLSREIGVILKLTQGNQSILFDDDSLRLLLAQLRNLL